MTLEEFNEISHWYELFDFSYDIEYYIDTEHDIYTEDTFNDYINNILCDEAREARDWRDFRDWLDGIPDGGYDAYSIADMTGLEDDDCLFDEVKDAIREHCLDYDLFEEHEEEFENYDDEDESDEEDDSGFNCQVVNGFINSFNQIEGGI